MALPRKKFREIVLQILFCSDFEWITEEDLVPFMMKELRVTKSSVREAYQQVLSIREKQDAFDVLIEKFSLQYELKRIPKAERNILRLGVFELLPGSEIPPKSVISEAVRLTRKFATRDSARFVNAVLDAIYKNKNETSQSTSSVSSE